MKKIVLCLFLIFMCSACSVQSWKYTSEPKVYRKEISPYSLVVPPLRDARENENSLSGYFISMIPLVPYGTSTINNPDQRMNVKAVEEFSKAVAEEIDSASIFKSSSFQFNKTGGDLYLVGTLKNSKQIWNSTFYGLSLPGDLLWLLGLPNGKYHFYIDIEYSLIDKSGNVYFSKSYSADTSNYTGLYYGAGDLGFEKILKQISLKLVNDLQESAPNIRLRK